MSEYFGPNYCSIVQPNDLLSRMRLAKENEYDHKLFIVDMRDARLYQSGHLTSACLVNCCTRTMARRAIISWDDLFADLRGCPAPITSSPSDFPTKAPLYPAVVLYDQHGDCPVAGSGKDRKDIRAKLHFINGLLDRGNRVFLLEGGLNAFRKLRDAGDFIDCTSPTFGITNSGADDSSCSETYSSISDQSDRSSTSSSLGSYYSSKPDSLTGQPIHLLLLQKTKQYVSENLYHHEHKHLQPELQNVISELKDLAGDETLVARNNGNHNQRCPLPMVHSQNEADFLNTAVSCILPYLYLGNLRDSQDADLLQHLRITHIVNVTNISPCSSKRRIHFLHLPANDTTDQNLLPAFEKAIHFIEKARKVRGTVLVHCNAGISRSAAVVIAYLLHNNRSMDVLQAFEYVQARRTIIAPNIHFMGQLQTFYENLNRKGVEIEKSLLKVAKLFRRKSMDNLSAKFPRSYSVTSFRKLSSSSHTLRKISGTYSVTSSVSPVLSRLNVNTVNGLTTGSTNNNYLTLMQPPVMRDYKPLKRKVSRSKKS